MIPKPSSYSYFLRNDHLCIRLWVISSRSVILVIWRNWTLKFLKYHPIVLDLTGCRKCLGENVQFFLWENVWKSVRNCMEVIENVLRHVKKQNLKIDRWVIFHPYANFNCPYLNIGLLYTCSLFCWSASHILMKWKISTQHSRARLV